MKKRINNLLELQAELAYLKIKKVDQEQALKERVDSPSKIFSLVFSVFKNKDADTNSSSLKDFIPSDLITLLSRIAIPGFLNGFLFKKSGFITKTLVTFLSQKAAKKVNTDVVTHWFDNAIDWMKEKINTPKVKQQPARPVLRDYGIPPDSETY